MENDPGGTLRLPSDYPAVTVRLIIKGNAVLTADPKNFDFFPKIFGSFRNNSYLCIVN